MKGGGWMRFYISGPISGLPYQEYLRKFSEAERELRLAGSETLNPAAMNFHLAGIPRGRMMSLCAAELACCDAIYMLRGWKSSDGARQEREWAMAWGKEIAYQAGSERGGGEDEEEGEWR